MTFIPNTGDVFSVATLLYARLRRVNGRVIDVVYVMQNRSYAQYVMALAVETKDAELIDYVDRLQIALDSNDGIAPTVKKVAPEQRNMTEKSKKKADLEDGHMSFSLF